MEAPGAAVPGSIELFCAPGAWGAALSLERYVNHMKYVSTRNQSVRLRASQAIAQGLARDGGLLTPEVFPKLTPALLEDLRGKTYGQRAVAVMKLFLEDFSEEELTAFTQAGYSGEKFDDARVAPLNP